MTLANELLLATGLTLAISLWFAIASGNAASLRRSLVGYFWGDSSLSSNDAAHLNVSTSFSLNGLLYQMWLGYAVGPAALWMQVAWCLGFIFMGIRSVQIRSLASAGTLHGVIGERYGQSAERAGALATIAGYTLQVGWELAVFVSLFSLIAPSASTTFLATITIAVAVVVGIYTVFGGLRGNLSANRFQNVLAGLALVTATVVALTVTRPGFNLLFDSASHKKLVFTLGWSGLITNLLFSLAWQLVDMSNWQTISSVGSGLETTKRAMFKSAGWVFLFPGVIGTVLGMALRPVSGITDSNVIARLLELVSGHWLIGFFVISGFVGAMLSTLDGLLLASAQAIVWDLIYSSRIAALIRAERTRPIDEAPSVLERDETRKVLSTAHRLVILLACVGATAVFAIRLIWNVTLFDLVYVVVISQMVLLPSVLSIIMNWISPSNAVASIAFGWIAGVAAMLWGLSTGNAAVSALSPAIALGVASAAMFIPSSAALSAR